MCQRKLAERHNCFWAECCTYAYFLWPYGHDEPTKRIVQRFAVSVANPTFCISWPLSMGPSTFCLASLLRMSTSNSQACHISHKYICDACGKVLTNNGLRLLPACFIHHSRSICSAVHLLSALMCCTCPNQAPAPLKELSKLLTEATPTSPIASDHDRQQQHLALCQHLPSYL
jgi:hypothetical protein